MREHQCSPARCIPLWLQGFYSVYRELFETLATQEVAAWEESEAAVARDSQAPAAAPSFGSSGSPAAEVFAFYSSWQSFVTFKDFAWADQYNPATAPNRQVNFCRSSCARLWPVIISFVTNGFAALKNTTEMIMSLETFCLCCWLCDLNRLRNSAACRHLLAGI